MPTSVSTLDEIMTEDLFSLLGLQGIPDFEKEEILENMNKTVHARVFNTVMTELSAEERAEFDDLSSEKIIPYLTEKGFDVPRMIVQESIAYRVELVKLFEVATGRATTLAPAA